MQVKFKKHHPRANTPVRATSGAAALDLHAFIHADLHGEKPLVLNPGDSVVVDTELSFEVPPAWVMEINIRSGIGIKNNVRLSNNAGWIDSDYRGKVCIGLFNDSRKKFTLRHGDRIAQFMIRPAPVVELVEVDELSATERGAGGLGSTGQ